MDDDFPIDCQTSDDVTKLELGGALPGCTKLAKAPPHKVVAAASDFHPIRQALIHILRFSENNNLKSLAILARRETVDTY